MQGRRSQDLVIIVYDPEIERTFRRQQRQAERARSNTQLSSNSKLKEIIVNGNQSPKRKMAGVEEEVVNNQKRPMKESYIPLHIDQPSTIFYPPNTAGNFTLTAQLLNMSQGNVTAQMAAMDKKIDMIIKAMASNSMLGQPSKENNPYSNTYNPGWRNHPNFSWGGNQNNQNNQGNQQQYQGQQRNYQHPLNNFSQNSAQKPLEDEFKSLVNQFIQSSQANFQQHSQAITNIQQSLAKLEAQMGQIANALSKREDGKFSSQTEINPKNHKHLKAITTITKELEKVYRRMRQHGTVIDTSMNGPYENPKIVDIEPQDSAGQNEIDMNQNSDKKSTYTVATPIQAGYAPYNHLQISANDDFLEGVNMDDVGMAFEKSEDLLSPMLNVIQDSFK
ncbi:hypothetical protein AAC387_Pa06g2063 [Persea americana]